MDERGAWEAGGENKGSSDSKKGYEKEKIQLFLQQLECVAEGEKRESDTTQHCVSACRAEASCQPPVSLAKNKRGRRGILLSICVHLSLLCLFFLLSSFPPVAGVWMHITVLFSVCFDHFYSLINPNKKADVKLASQNTASFSIQQVLCRNQKLF